MYTSTKPFIFVIIICIITFISFSFIIINFNNTIFKVETYQFNSIDKGSFNHYNLNRYFYKYQYLDHESNITISKNGNVYSSIQRTVYSPDSPIFRFFNLFFNLSVTYLILLLLIPLLLVVLDFTNLLKCNYEIRDMIRDGHLVAFSMKRKRDLCLSIVSVIFLVLVAITFGIVVALPLNLPSYFIKQDRFEHFSDPLCNVYDTNSTIGLHHIGKCKESSGQITLFNQANETFMKYTWGIGEYFTLIRTIVITTILVGLFLFLLICLIKYKKLLNNRISIRNSIVQDIDNNNNNNNDNNNYNNNNNNSAAQVPIATITPIGKSIIVS